jgi:hypothetical protein
MRVNDDRPRPIFVGLEWLPTPIAACYLVLAIALGFRQLWILCGVNLMLCALFAVIAWLEDGAQARLAQWEWEQQQQQRRLLTWSPQPPTNID